MYSFCIDIILIYKTKCEVNIKLQIWKDDLETNGFWLSMTKTKYMKWKLSRIEGERDIKLDGQERSIFWINSLELRDWKMWIIG